MAYLNVYYGEIPVACNERVHDSYHFIKWRTAPRMPYLLLCIISYSLSNALFTLDSRQFRIFPVSHGSERSRPWVSEQKQIIVVAIVEPGWSGSDCWNSRCFKTSIPGALTDVPGILPVYHGPCQTIPFLRGPRHASYDALYSRTSYDIS